MFAELDIAGASIVAGMQQPTGAPAHVGVFTRWHKTANSIPRRYRGAHYC